MEFTKDLLCVLRVLCGESSCRSYALAHARGENTELVAILGDGAARDLDTVLLQDVDDGLIGQRMLGILVGDELLDLRLDAARRIVRRRGR